MPIEIAAGEVTESLGAAGLVVRSWERIDATLTVETTPAGDAFRLSVQGAGWAGDCQAREAMFEGAPVSVMVRPESFELGEPRNGEGQGSLRFSGRVDQSIFRGSHSSIVASVGDTRLQV